MKSRYWNEADIEAIEVGLIVAKHLIDRGSLEAAERLYTRLLRQAEASTDGMSLLTGLVLLDQWDFYQYSGRADEASLAWERVRQILIDSTEWL